MKAILSKNNWVPYFFLALAVFTYFILPQEIPEPGRRILSIFVFALFFWGFELIPLYATSLWIVVLLSFFYLTSSGRDYNLFFSSFSNPLILLFFGGFILAAALRKHHVDEFLMEKILHRAGLNSYSVLASILFMTAFFSMWISNTAAAAMMLGLSKPLFESLSQNDPMRKALPLSIAFGANIGGMSTPIGTPPNAIALGILREYGVNVSFLEWMLMAVPLTLLILVIAFILIAFLFPPKKKSFEEKLEKKALLTKKGKIVIWIAVAMIFMWLTGSLHGISESWVALLGAGLFASLDLISTEDLKKIDWDILILMWGGLALGTGIEKSQLLSSFLSDLGQSNEFVIIAVFCLLALFLSSFISNTATANLLLPFAVGIAAVETKLIAIPVALMCSLAMVLPVSTPPNALAYSWGSLKIKDMNKAGLIIAAASFILILSGFKWVIPWTI